MKKVYLADKLQFLFQPARYKVAYGGRGGSKSRGFASALVIFSRKSKERILCCREIQKSIKDSVKKIIEDEIDRLGWGSLFHITNTGIICKENGSEFIFAGLRDNVDSIKSMEGITKCWCEEAHTLSQNSLDILIPTIRAEGSEIWFSYNPKFKTDPVHKTFVVDDPPPDSIVVEINHADNPWFPDVLKQEMEWQKHKDHDKYLHIWEGQCVQFTDEQIMRGIWSEAETPEPPEGTIFRYGLDFGFGADPNAATRFWFDSKTMYIDYEYYGYGVDIDDLPSELEQTLPGVKEWPVKADSARPDSISYLNKNGFRVIGAKKGPNSIQDGISRLRGYEIVIHPRCKYIIEEFTKYSYKKDKHTEEILPIIVDDFNHGIDGLRYATEGIEASNAYISSDIVDAALGRTVQEETYQLAPKVLSVYFGNTCVITQRQGVVAFMQTEVTGDIAKASLAISNTINNWHPQTTITDISTDRGGAVVNRLRAQGYNIVDVNPIVSSGTLADHQDLHSEMWAEMRDWLPLSCLPRDPHLKVDLLTPDVLPNKTGSGKYVVESVESIKKRTSAEFLQGKAQSLALSFSVPVAITDPNVAYTQAERDWMEVIGFGAENTVAFHIED